MRQVVKEKHREKIVDRPTYTLLIDGNNLAKIAISADKTINRRNEVVGGIYRFLSQVRKAMTELGKNFDKVYVMWDGEQSGMMRYKLYPDYKANRDKNFDKHLTEYDNFLMDKQRKILAYSKSKQKAKKTKTEQDFIDEEIYSAQVVGIKMCLEELFIRQYEYSEMEGDDLIAYYVQNKEPNEKIVILSNDRDIAQLISPDVALYISMKKQVLSTLNYDKILGYHYENILLKKIICGDASDNIKGIRKVGDKTLMDLMPEIKTRPVKLEEVIQRAKEVEEERKLNKKKPLQSNVNIIEGITDGVQGEDIYDINRIIIDLKNPLLCKEAKEELLELMKSPIDPHDRGLENFYKITLSYDIPEFRVERNHFITFTSPFNQLINKEIKLYNSFLT